MKIMPQNIKEIKTSNSTYKCLMDNAQINVSFVAQNIISIEYSINSYKTPDYLTKATDYLENNVCLEPVCSKKIDDNNKVIISSGNTEVIIDKGFRNVEIRLFISTNYYSEFFLPGRNTQNPHV
ncbi:MAG: hypothetical protein HUK24_04550, partial [Sphaerochaetaceae bacterium]|nr:hypothetical protein [Sphaerochaetaceae bacterium]